MWCTAMAGDWMPQVTGLIEQGEFAQAQQVIDKLPSKIKKKQAARIDSAQSIMSRINRDFSMTPEQGRKLIEERMPDVTDAQIENWKQTRKLEVMNIDGQERWFRKSVRNLWLLADEMAEDHQRDHEESYRSGRHKYLQAMRSGADENSVRNWHHANITFTLDVVADAVPAGETLRVWMPIPFENVRQRNVELISSNLPATLSDGSIHHTVYMEAVAQQGQPTHFEYTFAYDLGERHIAQQDMLLLLRPYRTDSEIYQRYTAAEAPHILVNDDMHALALDIVGDETNPVLQASMIYKWISRTFPWAGAREYSTIPCIPQYVLDNGHGDCGQVALLYISLVRSLGIPARWESGWQIPPDEINYHDWVETYFEGVGWVYTDPSYGRGVVDTPMSDYFASGMDMYRMATNEGVCGEFSPAKTFIRSETVDCQAGEVEWRGGNLFYDKFSSSLKVNSLTPCNNSNDIIQ